MSRLQVFDQDGNAVPVTTNPDGSFSFTVPPGVTALIGRVGSNVIDLGPRPLLVVDERTDPPTVHSEGLAVRLTPGGSIQWGEQ